MYADLGIEFNLRTGRGFKTDVDELVKLVRSSLGLAKNQRLPATDLAKRLGIAVSDPHQLTSLPAEVLEELIVHGKDRWSATLIADEATGRRLIIQNPTHSECRKESNIFHEISHQFCGHAPDEIQMIGGLPIRLFSPEKESQAEFMGFALHLPRDCLFWAAFEEMNREEIGEHFCASSELVRLRINNTSIERILKRKIP